MTLLFLGTFAGSLLLSFVLTKVVRDFAVRKNWLSAPASHRHLHNDALPRLGGVAIVFSFLIATGVALLSNKFLIHSPANLSLAPLATILPPAILIFLLGIYDDRRNASPLLKFSVQAVAGAMLFAGGLRILALPVLFGTHRFSGVTGLALTILWVIAITNAFNLIDGLDGLAAGSALFSTLVQSGNNFSGRLRQSLHRLHAKCAVALRVAENAHHRCSRNPNGFFWIANTRNVAFGAAQTD